MSTNIYIPTEGGYWDICESPDPEYPGLDIEFVSNKEAELKDDEFYTRPRVVLEFPNKSSDTMRALLWTKEYKEDYTREIIFENCHRLFEKRMCLNLLERKKLDTALNWKEGDDIDGRLNEDDTWSMTADFGNGMEMDIKVCGCQYDENGNNAAWTEAVLFKDGVEVACTEPGEEILGDWELEYNGDTYRVIVDKR